MQIKELYKKNINIQQYFREESNEQVNTINSILFSYDYQAGNYTKDYFDNTVIEDLYLVDGKKVNMTTGEFHELFSQQVAEELKALSPRNVLEVGIGEATHLCDIALHLGNEISYSGLELSLSRLLYAQRFAKYKKVNIDFTMGDMFSLPYPDHSFDVILLIHCLESNTGREREALKELLRVVAGNGYIVMLEPSYELGNEETKKRIERLCYIDSLMEAIEDFGLEIIKHELFRVTTYNNNTGLTIVRQRSDAPIVEKTPAYICPSCKTILHKHDEAYFCPECYSLYPIIQNIPILNKNHAILCSKYETEEEIF